MRTHQRHRRDAVLTGCSDASRHHRQHHEGHHTLDAAAEHQPQHGLPAGPLADRGRHRRQPADGVGTRQARQRRRSREPRQVLVEQADDAVTHQRRLEDPVTAGEHRVVAANHGPAAVHRDDDGRLGGHGRRLVGALARLEV